MTDRTVPAAATPLMPALAILLSSVLWGLYWIPMRQMEAEGIEKAWPSLVLNGAVLGLLLPIAVWRWRRLLVGTGGMAVSGLLMGLALSLYGISLNLTEVVRAILLFYLSPAWSTAIGLIWLGERMTARRAGALLFGFVGLMVVLEADSGLPLPETLGDWMAIAAGMAWSVGSTRIFVGRKVPTFELSFAFVTGTVLTSALLIALIPASQIGHYPGMDRILGVDVGFALLAIALLIPIYVLTIWGAKRLPPATVGILLLGEIVVAVISAALLLPEEPFGLRQGIGAVLITAAGIMEVLPRRRAKA